MKMKLIRSNLIICTTDWAFGVVSKTYHQTKGHVDFLIYCSRSFTICNFTYNSFLFKFHVRDKFLYSFFFFFVCVYLIVPPPFVIKIIIRPLHFWQKLADSICVDLFLGFWLLFIDLRVYFLAIPHNLDN